MPAVFTLKKDGVVEARLRIKRTIDGVPTVIVNQRHLIKGLSITESDWNRYRSLRKESTRDSFLDDNTEFAKDITRLKAIGKKMNEAGENLTGEMLNTIIHDVMYAEEIEEKKRIEAERKKEEEEKLEAKKKKEKMTLTKFIDQYIQDVKDGTRTTLAHGRTFVQGSRFSLTNSLGHFKEFMKDTGITYDFQDVDLDCYVKYKAWLMAQDISKEKEDPKHEPVHYADNTIGGFIKKLKCVLRAAESRGYPVNPAYKSTEFKA